MVGSGTIRFLVASCGKPVAGIKLGVPLPGGKQQKGKTDDKGLTAAYDAPGCGT